MKYFGAAVRSTIPPEPELEWEFTYINWWVKNEEVSFFGTEAECLKKQQCVESWGFTEYCSGYGPDRALTVYIGPAR